VGTWNLCLGAIAALIALATGLAAVIGLQAGAAAHQAISLHVKWAIFTTLALVLLAVWRGAGNAQESRPSWLFVIVLSAATAALIVTGYRGGQNVYRYGIGVHMASYSRSILPPGLLCRCLSRKVGQHIGFERPIRLRHAYTLTAAPAASPVVRLVSRCRS